jgi:hypothetical protein
MFMAELPSKAAPSDLLRSELEGIGWAVVRERDDLTWEQATALARSILHEYTRHYAPQVAALIDAGDFNAAAAAFMANLHTPTDPQS